jgi:hypothetical protein
VSLNEILSGSATEELRSKGPSCSLQLWCKK